MHIEEEESWRLWEERHPDRKREEAKRRFREKPYQLQAFEEMRKSDRQEHK